MPASPSSIDLPAAAIAALRQGNKVEAIKIVRAELGLGLKEAKDAVEDYERAHPSERANAALTRGDPSAGRTWLLVTIAIAVLVGCYFYFRR
ncbi:MAG: ribosomal protein L7/L12 [Burkholderiales bacterium]|nr:ribosomal protein L7/L12 [Burkholderiales bacterium]